LQFLKDGDDVAELKRIVLDVNYLYGHDP